jgi:hypothetical protein
MELAAAQCTVGDVVAARTTLKRIEKSLTVFVRDGNSLTLRNRSLLLARIARSQRRLGDTAQADELFRQALELARQQPAEDRGRLERCEAVIQTEDAAGAESAKHIDAALADVQREWKGRCPDSIAIAIAAYRTKQRDWAGAEALLTEPDSNLFPNMSFMSDDERMTVVSALVRQGRTDALLKHAERTDSALLHFFLARALFDAAPVE